MKWEVGCAAVSTTTSIGLLVYIVCSRPSKPLGAGPRDVYLERLCQSLHSLPNEEWDKVRAKLDVFLGVSPPPVLQLAKTAAEVELPLLSTEAGNSSAGNSSAKDDPAKNDPATHDPTKDDDSAVAGFRKMLKMGIPPQAVRNKMMQEKIDPALLFGNEASAEVVARSPGKKSALKTKPHLPALLLQVEAVPVESTGGLFCRPVLGESAVDEEVAHAIQQLFLNKAKPATVCSALESDENAAPSTAAATTAIIPARRAQNILIGLIKLKRPAEDICHAIANMHAHSLDDLQLLANLLPTAEEIKLVGAAAATTVPLGRVDGFVHVVGTRCHDARSRVQCLLFLEQNQIQELTDVVVEMTAFCDLVVQQSEQFALLLSAASVVAFALNQTPPSVVSIRNLGANLLKTKTRNGKVTAANLVALQFKGSEQELVDRFPPATATPFPSLAAVDAQLRTLGRELDKCAAYMPHKRMDPKHAQAFGLAQQHVAALKLVYARVLCGFGLAADCAFPQFVQDVLGLVNCLRRPASSANWTAREHVRLGVV